MKIFGVVLIVLGILGFVFGGVKLTHTEKVADIGPIEINKEKTNSLPVTPIASGAILIAGIVLLVVGAGKK
ncbi:MAG: hypothetical protein JWQ90_5464 [Hydrocarboniphaga sp.]|uniref:DUF3185 domain-containing protein n=1 Tax=Hydrocarboniphaga sp. TaxID=2033016 RepID=UPI0026121732|nr:DUF3185 domain-containing protein [Hydrocarboniphaga sp.]MDB5973014.1 hypothetical protein [Hydrocarboniphaga sp.]